MSYTKQTWNNGDVITAEKLNHMEDGIAAGGGSSGGNIVLHFPDPETATPDDTITIGGDKATLSLNIFEETNGVTFQDVIDAFNAGYDTVFKYLSEDTDEELTYFETCTLIQYSQSGPSPNLIQLLFDNEPPFDGAIIADTSGGPLAIAVPSGSGK